MPLIGWALGHTLQLPVQVTAGLILLGSCPGGTASNVICYLARGDVALSITLTAVSTTLAVFVTPILTWLYAGQMVAVPTGEMLLSILMVVLVPVLAGLALIKHLFPMVSVGAIVLIIAVIVALNRDQFDILGGRLASAVVLHNLIGLSAGYALAKLVTRDRRQARTLAIEVGMQNSGLAVALSLQYFSAMAALPGALFSVWHNLSGSLLASWWARRNA
jgi:BASS family bile acid:Na+ symporter